jgi:hypothetical protein
VKVLRKTEKKLVVEHKTTEVVLKKRKIDQFWDRSASLTMNRPIQTGESFHEISAVRIKEPRTPKKATAGLLY